MERETGPIPKRKPTTFTELFEKAKQSRDYWEELVRLADEDIAALRSDLARALEEREADRKQFHVDIARYEFVLERRDKQLMEVCQQLAQVRAQVAALEGEKLPFVEMYPELDFMRREYGEADDHTLTRDAIDLKQAICRVWDELELHSAGFPGLAYLAALPNAAGEGGETCAI